MSFVSILGGSSRPRPDVRSTRWKVAGLLLAILALSPMLASGAVVTAVKATLACVALGFVAVIGARAKRERGSKQTGPEFRVVARSSLSPRTGLALIELGPERLLVGFGEGFVEVLSRSSSNPRRKGRAKK